MKTLPFILLIPISSLFLGNLPALAGRLEPTDGECFLFQNGQLKKRQICTYSGYSWAGGGVTELDWKDGMSTAIQFGVQGRGERPCPEVGVDSVCGEWHYRHPTTFAPLPNAERRQTERNGIPTLQCVDVNNNSVCWRAVSDRKVQHTWIESETKPDPILERAILQRYPTYISNPPATYRYAKVDLNGDGVSEIIVHLYGSYFCGSGGCTTLIFQISGDNYRLVNSILTSHPPIVVLNNASNGWHDLILYSRDAVPTLVQFGRDSYGEKIYLDSEKEVSGSFIFATEYRDYKGLSFPLNPSLPTDQYANNKENLVAINLGCTRDLKTVLGQNAPDYCRSAEGDSGILFDEIKNERQADQSIKVEMRVFNRGSADGLIEIYDSNNRLVDIKIIERNEVPPGLLQSGYDLFTRVPASFFSRYPIGDTRRGLKEQKINLIIPYRGYIKITKSSPLAYWYNAGLFAIELATFDTNNPEFTKSKTMQEFLIGFAKESANKGIINIFKGEPSVQGVFSLDFVDKNKLAEVLQKLFVYSTTIETKDPSKNPLIGGFKDVYIDSMNMGLENILDKYVLPGFGSLARGTRLTATSFNIFARASDLDYSWQLGEKATATLEDSAR